MDFCSFLYGSILDQGSQFAFIECIVDGLGSINLIEVIMVYIGDEWGVN